MFDVGGVVDVRRVVVPGAARVRSFDILESPNSPERAAALVAVHPSFEGRDPAD